MPRALLLALLFCATTTTVIAQYPDLPGWSCPLRGVPPEIRPGDFQGAGYFDSPRGSGKLHGALDLNTMPISGEAGEEVFPVRGGLVVIAAVLWQGKDKNGKELGLGSTVMIDHGDGDYTVYGHLGQVLVKRGDLVSRGTAIGSVGYTGNARALQAARVAGHLLGDVDLVEGGARQPGEQADHGQQEEEQAEDVDVDRAVAGQLAVDQVDAHVLVLLEHVGRTEHHGDREEVPLHFEPGVGARVEPVANEGVTGADHRGDEDGPRGELADPGADPVHTQGEFQ